VISLQQLLVACRALLRQLLAAGYRVPVRQLLVAVAAAVGCVRVADVRRSASGEDALSA
jgi:hypothetical protein